MHVTGFPTFALFDSPPGRHLEPVVARRAGEARPLPAQGCAEVYPQKRGATADQAELDASDMRQQVYFLGTIQTKKSLPFHVKVRAKTQWERKTTPGAT